MRILLDFEGTLCANLSQPPPDAAVAVIMRLKAEGHRLTILSSRAAGSMPDGWRARQAARQIAAYLDRHRIPYDEILTSKPRCDLVIDSRAMPFDGSWAHLARQLRRSGV